MQLVILGLYLLSLLVVAATLLPLWRTTLWWVRLCDFPRFQIAVLAAAIIVALPFARWPLAPFDIGLLAAVLGSALWQLSWVWRYFIGAPLQVPDAAAQPGDTACISLLTVNVLQTTREAGTLIAIIHGADPDLVLAVETDEWWCAQLNDGLRSHYPHTVSYPLSNGYGLSLFSRLELLSPEVRFLVDDAIPSLKIGVRLRSGAIVDVYGMHPQPPAPQQDSTERDTELLRVAQEIKTATRPSIVLGDLNDVAWSNTTLEFAREGGLLDPRQGRGFFNTYPAAMPGLRYPLDYIFHTRHFTIGEMRVLPRCQSDHLPLIATLCLRADG